MEPHIYGVTEVNQLVKGLLDSAPALQGVAVRGELSNYKISPSGHHYFTLKDQEGALRCVMFRGQASRLRFRPENGMKAVASGRITVFPRDGAYQLYCDSLIPEGVGDLAVAFQQLKEKLWKEGLFDPAHKKHPSFCWPGTVGNWVCRASGSFMCSIPRTSMFCTGFRGFCIYGCND